MKTYLTTAILVTALTLPSVAQVTKGGETSNAPTPDRNVIGDPTGPGAKKSTTTGTSAPVMKPNELDQPTSGADSGGARGGGGGAGASGGGTGGSGSGGGGSGGGGGGGSSR